MNQIPDSAAGAGCASIVEMLDRADDLPAYVEEQLTGPNLLAFVRNLEAIKGAGDVGQLHTELVERILASGLTGLTDEEFQSVMRRPKTLLPLQKAVLLGESTYWDRYFDSLRSPMSAPSMGMPAPASVRPQTRRPLIWAVAGWAVAAAVLVSVIGPLSRLGNLQRQLSDERAQNVNLERDMFALKESISKDHPPVNPADLPEGGPEFFTSTPSDPRDLPENDPEDLPDVSKTADPGV